MPRRDVTKNFVRNRQFSPKACAKGSFRTITRGKLKLVICCPKGKWDKRSQRCRVPRRASTLSSMLLSFRLDGRLDDPCRSPF